MLGASRIAENAIVGPARDLGHRLVVVAARDPQRARRFADTYGVERTADSYADVVEDAEVDVVYNPLANSLHAPWNLAAIKAGKPVLTEKPFARNHIEAQQVADAAAEAGVSMLEGFHYLFHPVTQRMFELAANGELGEIRHVEVRMAMPAPAPDDPRWSLDLAGGALMDLGCYGLHIMRQLGARGLGRPAITAAHASQRSAGVDEWCDVELRFPSGATGCSANTMTAEAFSFTMKVVGTKGDALAHDFIKPHTDDRITIRTPDGTRVEHLGTRASYTYQLDAFAAHVLDGAPLPIGVEDAVHNMHYVDAAYRAAGMSPR
ncbi:oxidoreductase [Mycolicibacterium aichiense]|uniref:Oxidoreductase n=1 Tax=Mycolicibacterium aichiense TaxID=1799 RepID=A0AAD1HNS2_9MYCO|nr:oxidoreductase [Mycolicibacterium aichiense]